MARLLETTVADKATLCYRVRAAMGVSKEALAEELGASLSSVKNWEAGARKPSGPAQKALLALAKKLGVVCYGETD